MAEGRFGALARLLVSVRGYGQRGGYGTTGTMTVAFRRCGTQTLRAGTDRFDRGQPSPLVLVKEPAQLGVFGSEALEILVAHLAPILGELRVRGQRVLGVGW